MVFASSRSLRGLAMILRGYLPDDLDAMHALDVACFERPFRFTRAAMRRFAEAAKARVVIAEEDDGLAGFVVMHVERSGAERVGYIVTLDVAAQQRRKGIAGALMLEAERQAVAAGCSMMALHVFVGNAAAIGFYESAGFERSHRVRGFYGEGLDAMVYHRVLADRG
jgi:ribosomal-protein-alanine N-acetyltransferase